MTPIVEPGCAMGFHAMVDGHWQAARWAVVSKHFRKEGARLIPEPTEPDPYAEEAYRLWAVKQQSK